MKREEKNLISRQKILNSAMLEFSKNGYARSSINTICSQGSISKGSLYHYFKDKDEIYLVCIKTCLDALTAYLRENVVIENTSIYESLQQYFSVRQKFFLENPVYHKLFCNVTIMPPAHLEILINQIKTDFDNFNIETLSVLLQRVKLHSDITKMEVIDTFRQYQDFINVKYHLGSMREIDAEAREKSCSKALSILLYGVVTREEI